jgi:hypothetical protein
MLLSGCSASSYVGRWHASPVAGKGVPNEADSLTFILNDDHTFAAMADDAEGNLIVGATGSWTELSADQIKISAVDGPEGTGQLIDKNTLLVAGKGAAFRLERQK